MARRSASLIEWGLRQAVPREPRVRVLDDACATGLAFTAGRVSGVEVDGAHLSVDVVVDALGRRTPTPGWLAAAGRPAGAVDTTDCGVLYYARYYRLRDGFELPDGPWILSPRGDLGYMGYSTFPGDNRTIAGVLAVPPGVPEWRVLRDAGAFDAAVAQIPQLRSWIDPEGVEAITDVLPMAGLSNSIRHEEPRATVGLLRVGDALCHTDPVLARGVAFGLVHAAAVVAALRDHTDLGDAGAVYAADVMPALEERFSFVSQLDARRQRMWIGEPVDFAHRDGDYALFTMAAAGAAAQVDPDVFRTFIRRIGLLDSTEVLDSDQAMQRRIEEVFQRVLASPCPVQGPPQEDMVCIIGAAGAA